jgi:hypothetical protein
MSKLEVSKKRYLEVLSKEKTTKLNDLEFRELLTYQAKIEDHVYYTYKDIYFELFTSCVNKKITIADFQSKIFSNRQSHVEEARLLFENVEKIEKLFINPKSLGFSSVIEDIWTLCNDLEFFNPSFCSKADFEKEAEENFWVTEEELEDSVKRSFLELKKYMEN